MAHKELKTKAIAMRKKGMSYSQILEQVPVSKSTLSVWLEDYPLSPAQLRLVRDINPRRIEAFRATMKIKREERVATQKRRVVADIRTMSKRELFISGFFLFWGEGAKTRKSEISLANTDPAMIRFFIQWLVSIGADKTKIRFTLHLYRDMDVKKEMLFWSRTLGVSRASFYKPYIKESTSKGVTYRNGFGHGTCNARYMSQELNDYVLQGLSHIRGLYENK